MLPSHMAEPQPPSTAPVAAAATVGPLAPVREHQGRLLFCEPGFLAGLEASFISPAGG